MYNILQAVGPYVLMIEGSPYHVVGPSQCSQIPAAG